MYRKLFYIIAGVFFCSMLIGCGSNNSTEAEKGNYLEAKRTKLNITIDGKADDWGKTTPIVEGLLAPWNGRVKDNTNIYICHDKENLYFLYTVDDETPICDDEPTEMSVVYSDRVEFFISKDAEMTGYVCAEIDPTGKALGYTAKYHRQFEYDWDFDALTSAATTTPSGYIVEAALPLKWLREEGYLNSDNEMYIGLYRGDATEPRNISSIRWITWIEPEKLDFHIPSSLGRMKLVK